MSDTCGWCGSPKDCQPGQRGGRHHDMCCLDGDWRPCWGDGSQLAETAARIVREDEEDRWSE